MRDVSDRVKEKDSSSDVPSDINTVSVGRLAVPLAVANAKIMATFPTPELHQNSVSTTWLSQTALSRTERAALKTLFASG